MMRPFVTTLRENIAWKSAGDRRHRIEQTWRENEENLKAAYVGSTAAVMFLTENGFLRLQSADRGMSL